MEKIWFARHSVEWADEVLPADKLDPSQSTEFSLPEKQLLEALLVLKTMDNPAYEMEANASNRETPWPHQVDRYYGAFLWMPHSMAYGVLRGQSPAETITPEGTAGFALWAVGEHLGGTSYWWGQGSMVIELARPRVAGDGIGYERERLTAIIQERLSKYLKKRLSTTPSASLYPVPRSPSDVQQHPDYGSIGQAQGLQ